MGHGDRMLSSPFFTKKSETNEWLQLQVTHPRARKFLMSNSIASDNINLKQMVEIMIVCKVYLTFMQWDNLRTLRCVTGEYLN